ELEKVGLEPRRLVAVEVRRAAAEKLLVEAPAPLQVVRPEGDVFDPCRHGVGTIPWWTGICSICRDFYSESCRPAVVQPSPVRSHDALAIAWAQAADVDGPGGRDGDCERRNDDNRGSFLPRGDRGGGREHRR